MQRPAVHGIEDHTPEQACRPEECQVLQVVDQRGGAPLPDTVREGATPKARPFFERHEFTVLAEQAVVVRGVAFTNFRMERDLCHHGRPD